MSPAPRSNVRPFSGPGTGWDPCRSRAEASAPAASATAAPTTRRAEIATTRPHGDTRIHASLSAPDPALGRRAGPGGGDLRAGGAQPAEAVRAGAPDALELTAALGEDQDGLGGGAQGVR